MAKYSRSPETSAAPEKESKNEKKKTKPKHWESRRRRKNSAPKSPKCGISKTINQNQKGLENNFGHRIENNGGTRKGNNQRQKSVHVRPFVHDIPLKRTRCIR